MTAGKQAYHLDENELLKIILNCKEKDEDSFHVLAKHYLPLIKKISSRYFIKGSDQQDLIQEGLIGLYKAVKIYDPKKGSSFRSIAMLCIRRNILQAIRSDNAKKQLIHHNSSYLYDEILEDKPLIDLIPNKSANPVVEIIKKETSCELQRYVTLKFSLLEKKVFERYRNGKTYKEIASELGVSIKTVDNAINRIRKKLAPYVIKNFNDK